MAGGDEIQSVSEQTTVVIILKLTFHKTLLRRKDMQYNTRTHYSWSNNRDGDYNSE